MSGAAERICNLTGSTGAMQWNSPCIATKRVQKLKSCQDNGKFGGYYDDPFWSFRNYGTEILFLQGCCVDMIAGECISYVGIEGQTFDGLT